VGSTTENVSVNGTATQVDTTTPTLRQVVDSARMADMPLNGRNAANLTTLVAGAVIAPSNNANQGNAKSFPGFCRNFNQWRQRESDQLLPRWRPKHGFLQ
jgi:hypothetical protein